MSDSKLHIPENYQTLMPYLILKDARGFFNYIRDVYGAKEIMLVEEDGLLRHGEAMIDGSTVMFAEATDQFAQQNAGMYLHVRNADESYEKALKAGASSIMPPADQSYGRSCGVVDPFGNTWWLTSDIKK